MHGPVNRAIVFYTNELTRMSTFNCASLVHGVTVLFIAIVIILWWVSGSRHLQKSFLTPTVNVAQSSGITTTLVLVVVTDVAALVVAVESPSTLIVRLASDPYTKSCDIRKLQHSVASFWNTIQKLGHLENATSLLTFSETPRKMLAFSETPNKKLAFFQSTI